MSKRLPPKWTSMTAPDPSPVEGVDNLPLPMGVNRLAVRQAEQSSEATPAEMNPKANGDNPSIADVSAFASGKDLRCFDGMGSKGANPTPDMPGAN
jgi:hypothetical protein